MQIPGIHHVTAIASDPQRNLDFYAGKLGLRLVKLTVNFDDPGTYHLYYGNRRGNPGTIMTFFPWPGAPRGRHGTGQATVTAFAIPRTSVGFWAEALCTEPYERFDEQVIPFEDPDGLALELVTEDSQGEGNEVLGLHGVTLSESGYESTAKLLTETFGYRLAKQEKNRFRYRAHGAIGSVVDVLCQPDKRSGSMGAGTVHHVAFRAESDMQQLQWREKVSSIGYDVTPVLDRQYFHSIYFREPGGVLFEIATDPPGFTIDEPFETLGTHLKMPAWLEPQRARIEAALPKLKMPPAAK